MIPYTLVELQAVEAVARLRGFRAAGRDLALSPSAVSHAVAAVEARLGVRLFNRTTRSVCLTDAGRAFVQDIGPALEALARAGRTLDSHRDQPSGRLRLTTSAGAARQILAPLILAYHRNYPEVEIEVVTDTALIDIVAEKFDAGIRLAETVPNDMIAVPLTREARFVVVGAPAYLERRPPPETPHDLKDHDCIRGRLGGGRPWRWDFEKHGEKIQFDPPGKLILDDSDLMLQAAVGGAGLAYLSSVSTAAAVSRSGLSEVLTDWTPGFPGLSLYYPGRHHVPAKLRAFIDLAIRLRP